MKASKTENRFQQPNFDLQKDQY